MAGGGVVFEPRAGVVAAGVAGGDVVFCVAIACLSLLSMIIFAAAGSSAGGKRGRTSGPVFVGGKGCGCGGCRAGAGVCGTYLS
ncbi:hypothetical protein GQ55_1G073000 [Panicum hallii var. hallii]|uniref:Uncharacterized protein n=1 Tax=Panicum hallii var. hallii TaxID=1504633 RepID=A0A2T7F381_9POAL|nr:hypothetical protein GQ55_1G073000 [Panicum hallii var. hallii]